MAQDPRALLQKADKALSSASGGLSFFGGRTEKYENAADLFTQAANAFRMQKLGKEAGQAFERAATVYKDNLNEPDDAANTLQEAFKAYRKTDPEDAARVLEEAVQHYTLKGNFRRAATQKQNLAEVYEVEIGDKKRALHAYETAADWFANDNAEALATKAYLKAADIAAWEGDYYKAMEIYEDRAKVSVNNASSRFSVSVYLFKACIVNLATVDYVGIKKNLKRYIDIFPEFEQTSEAKVTAACSDAIQAKNPDRFRDILSQYNQVNTMDNWKVQMCLRAKLGIPSGNSVTVDPSKEATQAEAEALEEDFS